MTLSEQLKLQAKEYADDVALISRGDEAFFDTEGEKEENFSFDNGVDEADYCEKSPSFQEGAPIEKNKTEEPESKGFQIAYSQITKSYSAEHLKWLCANPVRWNAGRRCDAEKYSKAAKITGLSAELIAYAYEVNRKNFPQQAAEAEKVVNSSCLGDLEIAKSVAAVLAKYDVERGAFFTLRKMPKNISFSQGISDKIRDLLSRRRTGQGQCLAMTIRTLRGQEYGTGQVVNNTFRPTSN